MGLDSYLYRREYLSNYSWGSEHEKKKDAFHAITNAIGIQPCKDAPHINVEVCVAYWRKANAIHKWFCDLDGGRDECQPIDVRVSDLRTLRSLADAVLLQPAAAESILPTQSGFFFGPTAYDEWYMEDMKNTVTQLDEVLADIPIDASDWDYRFIYQASW